MKSRSRFTVVLIFLAVGVALCATNPGAPALSAAEGSSQHYVVVNNGDISGNNHATILKLAGTVKNPLLKAAATLNSGEPGDGGEGSPAVQIVRRGSDTCVFMTDGVNSGGANQLSSFKYPGLTLVGNFTDDNVPNSLYPLVIVASGDYLFEGFSHYIASWAVGSGCALSLLQTTYVTMGSYDLATTPNGKALVGSNGSFYVESYAIGPNGTLTERGPIITNSYANANGLDITADSKYAIFTAILSCTGCTTYVAVFSINLDGSLGNEQDFGGDGSLGNAAGINFLRLSPNEKLLFASGYGQNEIENQIITLNFNENPLKISYSGCTTTLKLPPGPIAYSLATVTPSGTGEGLYVVESNQVSGLGSVALLRINSLTGCTTETPGSPFSLGDNNSAATSLVAWPPRPF